MIPAATIESVRMPPEPSRSRGVWLTAWRRLKNDRVGVVSLVVVVAFVLMVLLSFLGLIARDWQKEVALPDAPPSFVGPRRCRPALIHSLMWFQKMRSRLI